MGRHWTHKDPKRYKIDKDWREIAQGRDEQSAIIETKVDTNVPTVVSLMYQLKSQRVPWVGYLRPPSVK